MKKVLFILITIAVILGAFYYFNGKEAIAPVVAPVNTMDAEGERESVESYLRENISKFSPVPAVLGGTWYVVSVTVDLNENTGVVVYEDGHIQETRNFSYTTETNGEVQSLIIN